MALAEVIDDPDLARYHVAFDPGEMLFMENETSQDLYILLSGKLDVLKGNKKISDITGRGTLFGEMSFLLDANRTATVRARTRAEALRIPKEEVTPFLGRFPEVAREISQLLARRLEDSTEMLYGLREMSDQLPDAVILTDKEGNIRTLNRAAERLFGREWSEIRNQPIAEIYEEPEEYKQFLKEVLSRHSVNEKLLTVRHPQTGIRYVSTSTTVLYDTHYNFQGVLSISRDVTAVKRLERRYQRLRSWLIPSLLAVFVLVIAMVYGYPYFSTGHQFMDEMKGSLQQRMGEDQRSLKGMISGPFALGDRGKTRDVLEQFFQHREKEGLPYTGVVVLDKEKEVFTAYSRILGTDTEKMIGSSYAGIDFQGGGDSLHKVLSLYRVETNHPMGRKGIEMAFEMEKDGQFLGWLVFQMDTELLEKKYHLDEKGLKRFHFEKPGQ